MSDESKALTKYGTTNVEAAQAHRQKLKEEAALRRSKMGFLKTPVGKTNIRAMPPWKPGVEIPIKDVWMHKIKDPADLGGLPKANIPCNAKNHGKPCHTCDRCKKLRGGTEHDREVAFQWGSQLRHFMQVVALAAEKIKEGVVLYEFGAKVNDQVLDILGTPEKGGDVTHPVTGRNLIIDRTGTGKTDTSYIVTASMKQTAIQDPTWLDNLLDLDLLAAEMTEEQQKRLLESAVGATEFPPQEPDEGGEPEYTPPAGGK